ncbi:hypothetical protein PanWU01x14_064350, partial [Parasponia andersonii]
RRFLLTKELISFNLGNRMLTSLMLNDLIRTKKLLFETTQDVKEQLHYLFSTLAKLQLIKGPPINQFHTISCAIHTSLKNQGGLWRRSLWPCIFSPKLIILGIQSPFRSSHDSHNHGTCWRRG